MASYPSILYMLFFHKPCTYLPWRDVKIHLPIIRETIRISAKICSCSCSSSCPTAIALQQPRPTKLTPQMRGKKRLVMMLLALENRTTLSSLSTYSSKQAMYLLQPCLAKIGEKGFTSVVVFNALLFATDRLIT